MLKSHLCYSRMPAKGGPVLWFLPGVLILTMTGCTQMRLLPYFDQVMVLKKFGDNKDAQHKYVNDVDAKFDKLWAAVQSKDIRHYKTRQEVYQAFGPPILMADDTFQGQVVKRCLYRYAIQSHGPHKVYLYFNRKDELVHWDSV